MRISIILLLSLVAFGGENKSASKAMLLSLLFPGGGQFYTHRYIEGIIIGGAEIALSYFIISEHIKAEKATEEADYIYHRDKRNSLLWWGSGVLVFSVAHAYISAHMYGFKEEQKLGLKIGWRW